VNFLDYYLRASYCSYQRPPTVCNQRDLSWNISRAPLIALQVPAKGHARVVALDLPYKYTCDESRVTGTRILMEGKLLPRLCRAEIPFPRVRLLLSGVHGIRLKEEMYEAS
jgi:hypothetical protein